MVIVSGREVGYVGYHVLTCYTLKGSQLFNQMDQHYTVKISSNVRNAFHVEADVAKNRNDTQSTWLKCKKRKIYWFSFNYYYFFWLFSIELNVIKKSRHAEWKPHARRHIYLPNITIKLPIFAQTNVDVWCLVYAQYSVCMDVSTSCGLRTRTNMTGDLP